MTTTETCGKTYEHEGRTLVCGKSPRHGILLGPHRAQHQDKATGLYWSGEHGVFTEQDEHNRKAAEMAEVVADMYESGERKLIHGEGYHRFRYCGRTYVATQFPSPPFDTPWAVAEALTKGPSPLYKGDTRRDAIRAMAADMYGKPCPHGYGTGRDSCPGCDTYDQYESES